MTTGISEKDTTDATCAQCDDAAAKFYSVQGEEKTLLCSSECHETFYEKHPGESKPMLIELEEGSDQGKDDTEEELSPVFKACHRGEENLMNLQSQFQMYGESPNQKNSKGQTLLTYAIAKGDVRTLDMLLLAGAEIDAQDGDGNTALILAARLESEQKVEFLLKKGAKTTVEDFEGKMALHRAEQNKETKCVELLLEKDPSLVHKTDSHQQTVVHLVAGEGNEVILRYLLEHDGKKDEVDNVGRTPLHWAVIQGVKCTVEILMEGEGENAIDVKDKFGFYPIHYAVQINRPDIARVLVHSGCNLGLVDFPGRTPFVYAASCGYMEICEILLEGKMEIDASEGDGWTALHFAASKGNSDLCRLLLSKVTNIDPTNRNLNTPLHLATANEHKEVVEILMNNSSKGVGMKDEDGRTPVHNAAECDYLEVLKILVKSLEKPQKSEQGTESKKDGHQSEENVLDIRDNDNHTSLYLAASREYKQCCEVLLERGSSVDEETRPYLITMGLIEEPKEEVQEEEEEEEEVKEDEVATVQEEEGAMTARERYASSVTPPTEDPPIDLAPETDAEAVANNSRHIQEDKVMSARSSSNSWKSNAKYDSWMKFMEKQKINKDKMRRKYRTIPQFMGSPYLQPQVDCKVFRRYLIGHRTAHDIYSSDDAINHKWIYNNKSKKPRSRGSSSEKSEWNERFYKSE
ncbi:inversin-like [Asterias rubens]|uniref:inversin-like n=1 Tax=Asterias rubens TaxID=7604 RepID=UPI001454EA9A|nr:inversin-like [Asterias rubens]